MASTADPGSADSAGPGDDEFALIAALFAPLATHPGARGLKDDAALWTADGPTILTCDAIVEGVHFLPDDPIDTIAQKAVRVNLSDLAAKGAKAEAMLLSLIWPQGRPSLDLVQFAAGLKADIESFGCALLGGDMTSTRGPLTVSVTALGRLAGTRAPARSDARPDDDVWVTGTIGDGALGLKVRLGHVTASEPARSFLIGRYQKPQPRLGFGAFVGSFEGAAMDVSDGLIADARKMAAASGVGITLDVAAVPLSSAAQAVLGSGQVALSALLTGGDDYEILFTAPPNRRADVLAAGQKAALPVTRIGRVTGGTGVKALLRDGSDLGQGGGGFVHRLGSG